MVTPDHGAAGGRQARSATLGRYLLNHIGTIPLALLFSGGFALCAAGGLLATRHLMPDMSRGPHNELAGFILPLVVGVYGLVLGFVVVVLYDDVKEANDFVQIEAASLEDVYRYSTRFPADVQEQMRRRTAEYIDVVVNEEWPLLSRGRSSPEASSALTGLFEGLGFEPQTEAESVYLGEAVTAFREVHLARHRRLDSAAETLPVMLSVFIFVGALVVIGLTFFFGQPSGRAQMTMVVALGAVMGFTLMLVIVLDHPFAGSTAISPAHFHQGLLAELAAP